MNHVGTAASAMKTSAAQVTQRMIPFFLLTYSKLQSRVAADRWHRLIVGGQRQPIMSRSQSSTALVPPLRGNTQLRFAMTPLREA